MDPFLTQASFRKYISESFIILAKLTTFKRKENLISNQQAGFLKHRNGTSPIHDEGCFLKKATHIGRFCWFQSSLRPRVEKFTFSWIVENEYSREVIWSIRIFSLRKTNANELVLILIHFYIMINRLINRLKEIPGICLSACAGDLRYKQFPPNTRNLKKWGNEEIVFIWISKRNECNNDKDGFPVFFSLSTKTMDFLSTLEGLSYLVPIKLSTVESSCISYHGFFFLNIVFLLHSFILLCMIQQLYCYLITVCYR